MLSQDLSPNEESSLILENVRFYTANTPDRLDTLTWVHESNSIVYKKIEPFYVLPHPDAGVKCLLGWVSMLTAGITDKAIAAFVNLEKFYLKMGIGADHLFHGDLFNWAKEWTTGIISYAGVIIPNPISMIIGMIDTAFSCADFGLWAVPGILQFIWGILTTLCDAGLDLLEVFIHACEGAIELAYTLGLSVADLIVGLIEIANYYDLPIIIFHWDCPVDAAITDANGHVTSIENGIITEDIPGSKVITDGNSKTILLTENISTYEILTKSTGNETFSLYIANSNGENSVFIKFVDIPIDENSRAFMIFDTLVTDSQMDLDREGDGVIDETLSPEIELIDGVHPLVVVNGPNKGVVGSPMAFDGNSSYDPDGTIVSYEWDFRDGSTGTGKIVTHSYSSAENYDVTLTVTDNTGLKASVEKTITVYKSHIPVNLLVNPGFEQGLGHWNSTGGSAKYIWDNMGGDYCIKGIETNKWNLGRLYQDVTEKVEVGERYKIGGWLKTENVEGSVVIGLDYVLPSGWTPADGYIKEIGHVTGTIDWTYYESEWFTLPPMPENCVAAWFLFDFNNGKGTAYWDDVSLISGQQDTEEETESPDRNTITNTIGMEFVPIPAGEFEMGSPDDEEGMRSCEGPVHHVTIKNAFYMGRYEVTQKQWRAIMDYNPPHFTGDDDLPVEALSWDDVQDLSRSSTRKKVQTSTGCRQRRNGNMHVGQEPPQDIHLAIRNRNLAIMLGIIIIQTLRRIRSVRRNPIPGGCMTCMAMSGNGCRMSGIIAMMAHLLTAEHGKVEIVPSGSFAAVAGTTTPGAAGLRFAAATTPAAAAATSAFAFFRKCSYFLLYHFTTYMPYYGRVALTAVCACEAAPAKGATPLMPAARWARKYLQ
jgi:PKD repeat protein